MKPYRSYAELIDILCNTGYARVIIVECGATFSSTHPLPDT
jgi:hypothetical protein